MFKKIACGLILVGLGFGVYFMCTKKQYHDIEKTNCVVSNKNGNLIPRHVLLSKPDRFSVRLSPDGSKISYLSRNENTVELVVADHDLNVIQKFPVKESVGMFSYRWAKTNKHILMYQDADGDENDNIICFNLETGERKELTQYKKVKSCILAISENYPEEIRIITNERDPTIFDIYSLNIITGEKKLIFENKENFAGFILDINYKLKFVSKIMPDGSSEYFEVTENGYNSIFKISYEDSKNTGFSHLSKDGKTLYGCSSIGRDTSAVFSYDIETKKFTTILEDDLSDVGIANLCPDTYEPAVLSTDYTKPKSIVINEKFADINFLQEKFGNDICSVISVNRNNDIWLVARDQIVKSVEYYIFDRRSGKKELRRLFSAKPAIDKYELQPVEPVIIKSRDGLNLVSYLTKSATFTKDTAKKLVVLVHGGPWARDSYCAHPWSQLLANRGYSVLQINYRGSEGFGKKFINAIDRNLEKMNNDIIDGVNWAIENGIAEKGKIAIMGGSFGGYTTLAGLAFFPDIFCCGVDFCGPSNWVTTIKSNPPYWAQFAPLEYKTYGNPNDEKDVKYLEKISPYNYVDNVTKPLMVVQGANDPRVVQAESDQIVDKLKKQGKTVVYVLYPDEGHSLMKDLNRKSSLAFAEKFLAKFLGGNYEPINEEERSGSSFKVVEGCDIIE